MPEHDGTEVGDLAGTGVAALRRSVRREVRFDLSKYDDARRSGEVDDWTDHSDIGQSFDGTVLTEEEYQRVEDLYIDAVDVLAEAVGADRFALVSLYPGEPTPAWLGEVYEGRVVDRRSALRFLRATLRGASFHGVLRSRELEVFAGFDYYLHVSTSQRAERVLGTVEEMGLYPRPFTDEEPEDEPHVSRPADDRFWSDAAIRADEAPALVLERWAARGGEYGERWFLAAGGDFAPVAASVRRHSMVAVFSGVRIGWAPRDEVARTLDALDADGEDPRIVVFPRPEGTALRTMECGEGEPVPTAAELPEGSEFGYFVRPAEDLACVQAVWPGEDGRIVGEWPVGRLG
ncbi:hypothetical protein [Streptomyces sp. NPDC060194]|uniref:hypothetical protein n=1 Tax=Streptomyces sp. NPDC060194 TaxID=3347069 RepID=UPI003664DCE8